MVRVEYIRNIDRLIIRDTSCSVSNPKKSVLDKLDRYRTPSSIDQPRWVYEISPEQVVLIERALHSSYVEAPNLEAISPELSAYISENYSSHMSTAHKVIGDLRIHKCSTFIVDNTKISIAIGENGKDHKKLSRFEYKSGKITTVVKVRNKGSYLIRSDNILTFITDPFNFSFLVLTTGLLPLKSNGLVNIGVFQNGKPIRLNTQNMWSPLSLIGDILTYATRGITYEVFVALG